MIRSSYVIFISYSNLSLIKQDPFNPQLSCHKHQIKSQFPNVCLGNGVGPSMNLELVSLSSFPLAKCNDGTAAAYYR